MGLLRIDYYFTAEVDTLKGSGKIRSFCTAPRWWDIVDIKEEIENEILKKYPDAKVKKITIKKI
jgi:hypothetical protein